MVFLLFVVSLLLTVGGGAAALYGADTIRTETGATLAVAGAAMTCAGLLMFALTACLAELKKIRRLVEAGEGAPVGAQAPFPVAVAPPEVPAVTAAAVAAAVVAADRAPADRAFADTPQRPAEPEPSPVVHRVPEPTPTPALVLPVTEPAAPPAAAAPDSDVVAAGWDPERPAQIPAPPPTEQGAPEDLAVDVEQAEPDIEEDRPAKDETAPPVPVPSEPMPDAAAVSVQPPEERELVATYTSGDNTYFMYSDNAIEAETPLGRFRFGSMEELRVFVETGTGGMPLAPPPPRRD